MKCPHCNTLNKEGAKFCKNCGKSINNKSLAYNNKFGDSKKELYISNNSSNSTSNNSNNTLIICLTIIICAIIVAGSLIYLGTDLNNNSSDSQSSSDSVSEVSQSSGDSGSEVSKSWKLIDSLSGSGTGSRSYSIPKGKIKVEISAYPIKNYATNYLYVSSTTGNSAGVDWGSKSAVETRSDSMTFDSSGGDTIDIDYYETVSWNVDIYKYS